MPCRTRWARAENFAEVLPHRRLDGDPEVGRRGGDLQRPCPVNLVENPPDVDGGGRARREARCNSRRPTNRGGAAGLGARRRLLSGLLGASHHGRVLRPQHEYPTLNDHVWYSTIVGSTLQSYEAFRTTPQHSAAQQPRNPQRSSMPMGRRPLREPGLAELGG